MSAPESSRPDDVLATRLHDELNRAIEQLDRAQAEHEQLLSDPEVIQEDRDLSATLLEHARHQVASAEQAVEQFEMGTYGRCITCGGTIGSERLAALVDVTTCVNCAG